MAKQNLFNSIKLTKPKNNVFDLSHDVKLSCNMGQLVPTLCLEAVPGDRFNIGCDSLMRLAPMVAPMMHRCDVTMHYFFVPTRLLWDNWEKFITNQLTSFGTPYALPVTRIEEANFTKLADYLGIPTPSTTPNDHEELVSAFPFQAYQKIFYEYYRDQNLQQYEFNSLLDGSNDFGFLGQLRNRCWEHDYFTASLPWAQKGAGVDIPLGDIKLIRPADRDSTNEPFFDGQFSPRPTGDVANNYNPSTLRPNVIIGGHDDNPGYYNPNGSLEVEPTTINDLRRAFKLQEWLERAARGGSRYIESILAHFGVKSSDKRLQRPEYITGVKAPIIISEVLNMTGTDDAPQGTMAGHGVSVAQGKYGSYFCEEHGYIMGIMSVMPKTAYYQGINRMYNKKGVFDYYFPEFAHIGEQEVYKKELMGFADGNDQLFGYVPRYAEYKFQPNRVAGEFRTSLDFWHMARQFDSVPNLNAQFVESQPTNRIWAVTDPNADHLYCQVLHKIRAVRPMPVFGTPQF